MRQKKKTERECGLSSRLTSAWSHGKPWSTSHTMCLVPPQGKEVVLYVLVSVSHLPFWLPLLAVSLGEEGGYNLLIKMAPLGDIPEKGLMWAIRSQHPQELKTAYHWPWEEDLGRVPTEFTTLSTAFAQHIVNKALEQRLKNYKSKTHLNILLTNICHFEGSQSQGYWVK